MEDLKARAVVKSDLHRRAEDTREMDGEREGEREREREREIERGGEMS